MRPLLPSLTMDKKRVQVALNNLQSKAVDVQGRLLEWSVTTPEDRDSVREDISILAGYMDDVLEAVEMN